MTTRKRGDSWTAEVEVAGSRRYGTFPTRRLAEEWKATIRQSLAQHHGSASLDKSITVATVLERYARDVLSARKQAAPDTLRLNAMLRDSAIVDIPLNRLKTSDIVRWRDTRLKQVSVITKKQLSAATVARDMNLLRAALNVARREWGWGHEDIVANVAAPKSPQGRDRLISSAEEALILQHLEWSEIAAPESARRCHGMAVVFALETAMRLGEICAIVWEDVNLSKHVVKLRAEVTKNGKSRLVPLSPRALLCLNRIRDSRASRGLPVGPSDSVFGWKSESLGQAFARVVSRLKIDNLRFHDLRHTSITRLANVLTNPFDLTRMVGHADPKMTLRYYNEPAENIAKKLALAALPKDRPTVL